MLFLILQKDGREGLAGIQLLSDTPSDSDTDLAVPFVTIQRKNMRNKTLIVCSVLIISLKTAMEKTGYDVRNVSVGCTHFVLVWRKILFVSLVRDKHCLFLSLYHLYFFYFVFCNSSLCFLCKLLTSPN